MVGIRSCVRLGRREMPADRCGRCLFVLAVFNMEGYVIDRYGRAIAGVWEMSALSLWTSRNLPSDDSILMESDDMGNSVGSVGYIGSYGKRRTALATG
jgi:hypothetical protein